MTLLTLERVTKRSDGITAVDDVSFSIDRGHVVGFLGPNGAGKSTTMRMVTQVYEPDAGEVAGGADVIQQYLNTGLIEELEIALAAVLLFCGRRLFENLRVSYLSAPRA
jgi:ABC-type multidrug transport system ATPase subunit